MHGGPDFLIQLVAATGIALANFGGHARLEDARPIESSRPLAEGKDERIHASIETVILRNGPYAWTRDAEWDEYLIRIRALSDETVEIREIAIFDALDHRVESRSDREELVDGTSETARRYKQAGEMVTSRGSNGAVAFGAFYGVAALIAGSTAARSGGFLAGGVGRPAAGPVMIGVGGAFAVAGVVHLASNAEVNSEINRRATTLPFAVPGGSDTSVDLFFPITPQSRRLQVVYADNRGEHRLDVDTSRPPPTLVSRVDPVVSRADFPPGTNQVEVRVQLMLDSYGNVGAIQLVDPVPAHVAHEIVRSVRRWQYDRGAPDRRAHVVIPIQP
jgi:hypothetical protein